MDQKMLEDYQEVLTIEDIMNILHIGKNTAYNLLKDGSIKSRKIGRQYRVFKVHMIDFLKGGVNSES